MLRMVDWVVQHRDKKFRVPYISPFVDLFNRASIPSDKVIDFSIDVINVNLELYQKLKENNIKITLNSQTIALFEHNKINYKKYSPIDAIIIYCYTQLEFLMNCSYGMICLLNGVIFIDICHLIIIIDLKINHIFI